MVNSHARPSSHGSYRKTSARADTPPGQHPPRHGIAHQPSRQIVSRISCGAWRVRIAPADLLAPTIEAYQASDGFIPIFQFSKARCGFLHPAGCALCFV